MERIYEDDKVGSLTSPFRARTARLHELLETLTDEVVQVADAGWHPRDLELYLLNEVHLMFLNVRLKEVLEQRRAIGVLTLNGWKDNPRRYEAPDGFVTTDLSAALEHMAEPRFVNPNSPCISA